mmetsp:Transcript_43003/g.99515  ORF Transcript_43003/g.99515 Transcript_43003/m.99515 type:complete len:1770 (-) Transcript_43003:115-5424(-)
MELATGNEVEASGTWTSSFATFTTELNVSCANTTSCPTTHVLTFASARVTPHVVRVYAANIIGFGTYAETYEQAVDLPSAATGLTASVAAPNEIALSWILPSDTGVGDQSRALSSVLVDRTFGFENMSCTTNCASCTDGCISSQLGACCSEALASTSTSVTVTNVPASETRYYFRVRTGNDVGFGDPSNTTNEQGVSLPSVPTSLAVSYPTALAITFTWAIPADTGVGSCSTDCRPILNYTVTVTDNSGVVTLSETVAPTVLTRTVTDLSHQKTYTIAIKSRNSAGYSAAAAELLLIRPRDVPTVPTSFTAAVGNQAYEVLLSWGTPTDTGATGTTEPILEYVIEVDTVGSDFTAGNTQVLCGTGATCTTPLITCSCSSLSGGVVLSSRRATPYYFRIKATNQYGSGAWAIANQYSVGTPSQPREVGAAVVGPRTMNITWLAPSDNGLGAGIERALVSYIVQRSFNRADFGNCATGTSANDACSSTSSGACCTTSGLSTSTFSVLNTVPSAGAELFYFRVFAENEVGVGTQSSSASEQGVDVPSAPQNLDVATIGPAQFTVTWISPSDTGVGGTSRALLGYRLEVINDPETAFLADNLYFSVDLAPNVYTYTKTDFVGGTNYTFRVLASNDAGQGAASSTIKVPAIALPGPPTSFTATITGPLVIALQWAIPTDTGFGDSTTAPIREYAVNVSTTGQFAGEEAILFSGTGSDFSFVHSDLVKATGYYYRVFARTDAGWSDPAEAFEEGITVPTEPLALTMVVTSPLKIDTTWQLPADTGTVGTQRPLTKLTLQLIASSTEVYSPDWASATTTLVLANDTLAYNFTSLIKGYYYYARVFGTNTAGDGNTSTVAEERGLSLPDRPTGLTATIVGPLAFTVTWAKPADEGLGSGATPNRLLAANAYQLEMSTSSSFAGTSTFTDFNNETLAYPLDGLTKAQRYYFRIFCRNDAGTSVQSVQTDQQAVSLPSVPQNPSVAISTANELELLLTWQLPADTGAGDQRFALTSYRIQEAQDATPNSTTANITVGTPGTANQLLTRSGLGQGSLWYYRVFASNLAGESAASDVVVEMSITKPSAPLSPSLVVVGDLQLLLTWSAPTDTGNGVGAVSPRALTYYEILVDQTSSAMANTLLPVDTVDGTTLNYTKNPSSLVQGTVYYMTVTAYNSAGASPATSVVSETAIAVPSAPLNLAATVSNPLQIQLSWDTPTTTGGIGQSYPLQTYRLMRASTAAFSDEVEIVADLNLTRLETNLTKGASYYYRVFAVNFAGQSAASSTAFQQGIDVPSAPQSMQILHPSELALRVQWALPADTGLGDQTLALLRYTLEQENLFASGTNGTFAGSPFAATGPCYLAQDPPCNPATVSGIEVPSIELTTSLTQAGLIKGNTHYYRIRAVNVAGAGPWSDTVFEQPLVLPSGPLNIDVKLIQLDGAAAYQITWATPLETGSGVNVIGQPVVDQSAAGQARTGTVYQAQAAPEANWGLPDVVIATTQNFTAYKTGLVDGVVYHFRVAASNAVGYGPWVEGATSGPNIDSVAPTSGKAAGGVWVTVNGQRFGTAGGNLNVWIGQTRCDPVVMTLPDEQFRCLAPGGTGGSKTLFLSVVGLETQFPAAYFYLGPQVTGVEPGEVDADGGVAVTIAGENFGIIDMSPLSFLQARGAEACTSTVWSSDTSVTCWVPPATQASDELSGIAVQVDGQTSGPDGKVQLARTGLETFLRTCPSEATDACFDCTLAACYSQRASAAQATGVVQTGEALDECELAAAKHCGLDQPLE